MSNGIGSALTIPQSALDGIQKAEEKLENLKRKAEQTASGVTASFSNMAVGTKDFISALDKIIEKLSTINSGASKMSSSLGNLGTEKATRDVKDFGSAIENAAHTVDAMSEKKVSLNFSDMNIAVLKEQIAEINKQLNNTDNPLGKKDQQLLVDRRAALQEELKEQELASQKRAKVEADAAKAVEAEMKKETDAYMKELERRAQEEQKYQQRMESLKQKQAKVEADAAKAVEAEMKKETDAYMKELEKQIRERQQYLRRQAELKNAKTEDYNSSYTGSRRYSVNAKTLDENRKAIEYLNRAKMQLDTTDAHYAQRLESLNRFINRHKQVLREAGETASNVKKQYSYLQKYTMQLAQRMAVLFTFNTARGIVEQIAQVRGQFELSQRSLESILGNKAKADVIFQKTVNLALNSPFKIKQLVEYTRQLAAYRIENDKLYDTTKRLADVSAGLGVDMSRLILAYGQVKAAAYLRGSEVRQFTEAGVNMYGELQAYFKEVKGEAYSTGQIVDMISKRMVKFEDVEAIFKRMTDKGGMFYNMQEVQANTLYGMIQKMGDAFDKMLNEIGTDNEGVLKGTVSMAIEALKHWEDIVNAVKVFIGLLVSLQIQASLTGNSLKNVFSASFSTGKNWLGMLLRSGSALVSVGKAAKMLFSNIFYSLPQLAIMAVISALIKLKSVHDENNEANIKANLESAKTYVAIKDLTEAYNELAVAKNKAKDNTSSFDIDANISARKKKLQELIDAAGKEGLQIKIKVADIDERDLNKTFEKVRNEVLEFNNLIRSAVIDFNNGKSGVVLDGYEDEIKDYTKSVSNAIVQNENLDNAINLIKTSTAGLTKESKKYYDVIKNGKADGESQVAYMNRMAQALKGLNETFDWSKVNYDKFKIFNNLLSGSNGINAAFSRYNGDRLIMTNMFDKVLSKIREKYKKNPIKLAAAIDTFAAKAGWDDYVREEAYNWAKIPLQFDKNSVEDQAYDIDQYLRDYFGSKTYSIKLSYETVNQNGIFDPWDKKEKQIKEMKDAIDGALRRLRSGSIQFFKKTDPVVRALWADDLKTLDNYGGSLITTIPKSEVQKRIRVMQKMVNDEQKYWGSSEDTTKKDRQRQRERDKRNRQAAKEQRDIISERVSLLREMNDKYNELKKIFNEKESIAYTRMYFKEAAQNVGLNINEIIPSNEEVVKRLRALAKQYKEVGKRGDVLRIAADIEFNIKQEEYEKLTNKVSEDIEEAFAKLSLYDKLKDAGVSDILIRKVFDDVVVSYKDLRDRVDSVFKQYTIAYFNEKFGGESDKWSDETLQSFLYYTKNTEKAMSELFGEDRAKQYKDALKRIDEQEKQANIDMFVSLTKDYKTNLTERLQLDKWYAEERSKILKYVGDEETRQSYLKNLDKKYKEKSDANEWKDFKESEMYISLFENLDHTSTRVLEAMREKLQSLRDSLKNLSPSELKEIVKQIGELDTKINTRSPFKELIPDIKEYISYLKNRKQLEEDYINSKKREEKIEQKLALFNKSAIEEEQVLNELIKDGGLDLEACDTSEKRLAVFKENANLTQQELDAQKKITEEIRKQIKAGNDAGNRINDKLKALKEQYGETSALLTSIEDMSSAWGIDLGSSDGLKEIAGGWDKILDSLTNIDFTKPMSIITGAIGALTGVGKVFGGFFGWGTKDKHLQEEIENHQKAIENLQRSYEKLKDAMSDVYDMEGMAKTTDEMIKNLELTNANLKSMIALEEDKKKSDSSQIKEWQKQIDENEKAINEAKESLTESLGGFGSKSNYKSAAEAFSDAWVDAFKEGNNALDALNDKFDEYMENLLKKQLVARIAQRIFQPIFDAVDAAVAEDSDGGYNATKKEIENIKALWKERSEMFNDSAKDIIDSMGGTRSANSSLSGLQKGISSLSESTGKELEGVLESIRYYLATQQADVRAIRDTLITHLGNAVSTVMQGDNSSPVLTELRLQTSLLTDIRDTLSSCVKTGHSQGRSGIKVFFNN